MGMDRPHQVFDCGFEFHAVTASAINSVACGPNDVNTQNLSVFVVGNDLDEAFVLSNDRGSRIGSERELADFTSCPSSRALASVRPTLPISGWQ